MPSSGKIYLIPTLLGGDDTSILPNQLKESLKNIDEFIVENARSARRFLRSVGYTKNFDTEVIIHELDKHAEKQDCAKLLANVLQGKDCGILSEAGNPCIADPGSEVVAYAHTKDIEIIPLVGPSSILLALISSGFNGQQFTFNGYLPVQGADTSKRIKQLERAALSSPFGDGEGCTQIFMETPFRNQRLLEEILKNCNDETLLCIACDLTLPTQYIKTKSIKDWKKQIPEINKRYCIFLLGR